MDVRAQFNNAGFEFLYPGFFFRGVINFTGLALVGQDDPVALAVDVLEKIVQRFIYLDRRLIDPEKEQEQAARTFFFLLDFSFGLVSWE